jgi:hypothetical protein
MLTGRPPFKDSTERHTVQRIVTRDIEYPKVEV